MLALIRRLIPGLLFIGLVLYPASLEARHPGRWGCAGWNCRGSAGCAQRAAAADWTSLTTIQGKVESVSLCCGGGGPTLALLTDEGRTENIVVGPSWYLDQQNFAIQVGERITAKVARAADNMPFLAAELTKADGQTLRLRDSRGLALWARGRTRGCCR
ncbi:MAG: hypothetical protein AB1898_03325 [Acidobacteriota bacterium]